MNENSKRKISVIDLIFILILIGAIVLGVNTVAKIKKGDEPETVTKVVYTVEVESKEPEILNYIKKDNKVFENSSMKEMGIVQEVSQRPYQILTENRKDKTLTMQDVPNKITLDIKIAADGALTNNVVSVDSVNLLIGKTIDLVIGGSNVQGVIIGVEYNDVNEIKEAQE